MEDSILISIKQLLGPGAEHEHFDPEITMHINSVFTVLTQLGIGPTEGFFITDKNAVWTDFISDMDKLHAVKTYICLKVKLVFDPPSSAVIAEMKEQIKELEWRLSAAVESKT